MMSWRETKDATMRESISVRHTKEREMTQQRKDIAKWESKKEKRCNEERELFPPWKKQRIKLKYPNCSHPCNTSKYRQVYTF